MFGKYISLLSYPPSRRVSTSRAVRSAGAVLFVAAQPRRAPRQHKPHGERRDARARDGVARWVRPPEAAQAVPIHPGQEAGHRGLWDGANFQPPRGELVSLCLGTPVHVILFPLLVAAVETCMQEVPVLPHFVRGRRQRSALAIHCDVSSPVSKISGVFGHVYS